MIVKYEHYAKLRDARGLRDADITRMTGVTSGTLSSWKNGKYTPKEDKRRKIADALGVSLETLDGVSDDTGSEESVVNTKIPLFEAVAAGNGSMMLEKPIDYIEYGTAVETGLFAVVVRGNSMLPRIMDGDIVVVHPQHNVENGQIAIVAVNGEDATCKKVYQSPAGVTLVATNPAVYEPRFFTNEEIVNLPITILGRVIEVRGKV